MDEVLAILKPSQPRRWMGILVLVGLGAMLLWVALSGSADLGVQVAFLVAGGFALFAADRMRRSTERYVELTREVLRMDDGTILARVEDVLNIERGPFAFKPSNGFLVKLSKPYPRGWAPGLWWRRGKYLGMGGVVPGGQSRAMAEVLTALRMGVVPDLDPKA